MPPYDTGFVEYCLETYTQQGLRRKLRSEKCQYYLNEYGISYTVWSASIREALRRLQNGEI